MSKNHIVVSTLHTTTALVNMRRAQCKKGNLTEHGTNAEVNGSVTFDHDPDKWPTTVLHDTTLPNGHVSEIFGSASHESGTSYRAEGHLPVSPTANGGSSVALAARTRSTGLDDGTDWDEDDIVETRLAGGGLD